MSYKFTTEDRQAIVETATRLGIDPGNLTAVIAYETIGSMNPDRIGGAKNAYRGLIQFGPSQRKQYGYKPGMSIADQVRGPVYRYLADPLRGLKPGMGLAEIYSVINAGSLKDGQPRWNHRDQNGTIRYHVGEIKRRYFGSGKPVGGLTPPLNVGQTAQGRQMSLGRGRGQISSGPAVRQLQQQLAAVPGGPPVAVDGKYGPQTEAAVRAVEKKYGLTQERPGKAAAGPQVQAALAGNERLRIVADTQQRFGDPLAPGGFPLVGYPNAPPLVPPPQMPAITADRARTSGLSDLNAVTSFGRLADAAIGGPPAATATPRAVSPPPVSRFGTTDYFPENVSSADYTTGVPGRTGNAPPGINNFGDIADAWRRIGSDVVGAGQNFSDWAQRQFMGGPPPSTATPQAAPIPPAVPESASPYGGYVPGGYDGGRQNYGIPQQQSSPPLTFSGSGSTDVLLGGGALEDYLQAPIAGPPAPATVVPTTPSAAAPWSSPSAAPAFAPAGDPANPVVVSAGGVPPMYGFDADPSRLDPGTLDTTVTGGVPVAAPGGVPAGVPVVRVQQPHPETGILGAVKLGTDRPRTGLQRAGGVAAGIAGSAFLGPMGGLLARAIENSASRGMLDNAHPYTGGPVTSYDRGYQGVSTTPWGSALYTTPSGSQSASMFTPSGSGWVAPNSNTSSGGNLYAYQPNGQGGGTYIDSRGNEHPY